MRLRASSSYLCLACGYVSEGQPDGPISEPEDEDPPTR
jgi:hypothetical protein